MRSTDFEEKGAMREWVVCLSNAWGGLEKVVLDDVTDHLAHHSDWSVDLLVLEGSPLHQKAAHVPRLRVHTLNSAPSNLLSLEMRSWIKKACIARAQVIHVHQPSLLGSVVPWMLGCKDAPRLVVSRHIQSNHKKASIYHRWLYAHVDAVVVMSHALADNVRETHPPVAIEHIPLGIDFEIFKKTPLSGQSYRSNWSGEADTVLLGCVGRIDPSKGQLEFAQAAIQLLENQPDVKAKFVIVGESTRGVDPAYERQVRKMIQQSKFSKHFVWAGFVQDIPQVMAALDVLVMPSFAEAFGLVAIEAMAMGAVVVMSEGGSEAEILGTPPGGVAVPARNVDALSRAMWRLVSDATERQKMARHATSHVHSHFDKKARILATFSLYQKLIKK